MEALKSKYMHSEGESLEEIWTKANEALESRQGVRQATDLLLRIKGIRMTMEEYCHICGDRTKLNYYYVINDECVCVVCYHI